MPPSMRAAGGLAITLVACQTSIPGDVADGGPGSSGAAADARPCEESVPIDVEVRQDPPDLLVVLDRSGSMDDEIGGQDKWSIMRAALGTLTAERDDEIKFGLALYPSNGGCDADETHVAIGLGNGAAIAALLDATDPDGDTPTHRALGHARTYLTAQPANPAGRFVLLATDGLPTCGGDGDDSRQVIEQLAAMGVPTYVVGFGDVSEANPTLLRSWAMAGGTADFFPATSPAALDAALAAISEEVATPSCEVVLPEPGADPDALQVSIAGAAIPRDPVDGWDYDPASRTLTFHGASCAQIQGGSVDDVQIRHACGVE